jgi:hypothetical protein
VAVVYLYGTQVVGVTKEEFLNSFVYLSAFVETVATLVNSSSLMCLSMSPPFTE